MAGKKSRGKALRFLLFPVQLLLALLLPFLLLNWVAVLLVSQFDLHPWLAMCVSVILAFGGLFFFLNWISKKISGKKKVKPAARSRHLKIAGAVTALFAVYALFFLSGNAIRDEEVRGEYTSVHPCLRMAVGTFVLFDREAVITDLARTHGDYSAMGLEEKKKSLHYRQESGFVHAVDLRTQGRPEWKNTLMQWYFRLLGFNTLRHVGTADHLHVSLSAEGVKGI